MVICSLGLRNIIPGPHAEYPTIDGAWNGLITIQDLRARTIPPTGGQGLFIQGGYDGKLSPDGETLYLLDNIGYLIDTVTYPP